MHNVSGIYIHIPFCKTRCSYCDFYSSVMKSSTEASAYVKALASQMLSVWSLIENTSTIYIGGGTPSVLGKTIQPLLEPLARVGAKEFSIEVNPESFSEELLDFYQAHGLNRISIGIQSLQEKELKALGRLSDVPECTRALEILHSSKINYSADLMVGIPFQTKNTLQSTLEAVFSYEPSHVSVYPLQLESKTRMAEQVLQKRLVVAEEDELAELMLFANSQLASNGFLHYEVANYAKPGHEARHNMGYWQQHTYLGLGPSAASQLTPEQYAVLRATNAALPPLPEKSQFVRVCDCDIDPLSKELAQAEKLMLAARLRSGISSKLVDESAEVFGKANVERVLDEVIDAGLAKRLESGIAPTQLGWLLGNELYGKLLSLADSA